eukprot:11037901-Ditylum_brightwellii.AAC.1
MASLADVLAAKCGLKAAMFLTGETWPKVTKILKQSSMGREGWSANESTLRNTEHGGHIETDHVAVYSLPADTARRFTPPKPCCKGGAPMDECIR